MRARVYAFVNACDLCIIYMYIFVCVCACVCACGALGLCACLHVCVCVCVGMCLMRPYIYICMWCVRVCAHDCVYVINVINLCMHA